MEWIGAWIVKTILIGVLVFLLFAIGKIEELEDRVSKLEKTKQTESDKEEWGG
jgi:hypothetical protein